MSALAGLTVPGEVFDVSRAEGRRAPVWCGLRAIWPVVDEAMPPEELIAEALAALPRVALWQGVRRIITVRWPELVDGDRVPGSGGAARVVVVQALVELHPVAARRALAAGLAWVVAS